MFFLQVKVLDAKTKEQLCFLDKVCCHIAMTTVLPFYFPLGSLKVGKIMLHTLTICILHQLAMLTLSEIFKPENPCFLAWVSSFFVCPA